MVGVPFVRMLAYPISSRKTARGVFIAIALAGMLGACASADPMAAGLEAARKGDFKTAYEEWLPLAENGDLGAQYNIAQLYRRGQGVEQDYTRAAHWYAAAAEFFHTPSRYNLAVIYEKGLGVPINYEEARKLYRLAANQGHRQAQFNLGVMLSIGQGTEPDWPQAIMWYTLAARAGDDRAVKNLVALDERLTVEERERATELLSDWQKRWGRAE